jgi:hypothetical protein
MAGQAAVDAAQALPHHDRVDRALAILAEKAHTTRDVVEIFRRQGGASHSVAQ